MLPPIPAGADLEELRSLAAKCRSCPLYQNATQTVFGAGAAKAQLVLVGEQPGDKEDIEGKPFVGPAGRLLDKALANAGIDRGLAYVTNAVKHFKFHREGKRRMHDKPVPREVAACRPWLESELETIRPKLIVALGATAAFSLFESTIKVTQERGRIIDSKYGKVLVTVHPSSLLRKMSGGDIESEYHRFVSDLIRAREFLPKGVSQ